MLQLNELYHIGDSMETSFVIDSNDTSEQFEPKLSGLLSTSGLTDRLLLSLREFCDKNLPEGFATVAKMFHVTHLETVMIGTPVTLKIQLVHLEGNKLTLDCILSDSMGPVAHIKTERAVIAVDALIQATEHRRKNLSALEGTL